MYWSRRSLYHHLCIPRNLSHKAQCLLVHNTSSYPIFSWSIKITLLNNYIWDFKNNLSLIPWRQCVTFKYADLPIIHIYFFPPCSSISHSQAWLPGDLNEWVWRRVKHGVAQCLMKCLYILIKLSAMCIMLLSQGKDFYRRVNIHPERHSLISYWDNQPERPINIPPKLINTWWSPGSLSMCITVYVTSMVLYNTDKVLGTLVRQNSQRECSQPKIGPLPVTGNIKQYREKCLENRD